jgi:Tol biopolymer transport system component
MGWSPNGQHIAFKGRRRDNGLDEISVATLSNPSHVNVILPEFKGGNSDLFWSTDSRKVLLPLRVEAPAESQLFAFDRSTGGPPKLLAGQPPDRRISGADLSPDGRWFAIAATADPAAVLWSGQSVDP